MNERPGIFGQNNVAQSLDHIADFEEQTIDLVHLLHKVIGAFFRRDLLVGFNALNRNPVPVFKTPVPTPAYLTNRMNN